MARSIKQMINSLCKFSLMILLLSLPIQASFANNAIVIRGKSANFREVMRGMIEDLEGEVKLTQLIVKNSTSVKDIKELFKQSPDLVILMGNKAVNLYGKFQAENANMKFPPTIAMAALFIDKFVKKLKNTTAIRYEIPAVTSAVVMRTILGTPVKRLGVIYREWMEDIIVENGRFCKAEGIELVGIKLPNKSSRPDIDVKNALKKLSGKVDALWILNDNSLLTAKSIGKAWIPARAKSKMPAIVGIKLFMTKFPLGSFAIVPDDYGLGAQAAGMIFEIMENDWQLDDAGIQQPVSVKKFISTAILDKQGIRYQSAKLSQVDEVIR